MLFKFPDKMIKKVICGKMKKIQVPNVLFGNKHLDSKNGHEDEGNAAQRVVQTLHLREAEL